MAIGSGLLSDELLVSLEASGDLVSWINEHLEDENGGLAELTELDKRVGSLATRLEILHHAISNDLEQTLETTSRGIPRIAFDLQFMRESALNLQSALDAAQATGTTPSDDTIQATLERLHQLDLVKSNMSLARHILRETENWNTLESEVIAYIHLNEIPSFRKAANRLNDASKSLPLFQNTLEFEPRKSLVTSLENQLEASLSASLVAAANATNISACKEYYEIFQQIRRETEFRSYYNGARRADVVAMWNEAKLSDCGDAVTDSDPPMQEYVPFIRQFLLNLESLVLEEKNVQTVIFPRPVESLSTFIQSTFDALIPSFSQRMEQFVENGKSRALSGLISTYQFALQFIASVSKVMDKLSFSSIVASELSSDDLERTDQTQVVSAKSRRLSKRLSMSRRTFSTTVNAPTERPLTWEAAILEPFLDYQSDYARLEKTYLDEIIASYGNSRDLKSNKSIIRERYFRERSIDIFSAADDAISHCMAFTSGYGSVGLVGALEHLLTSFLYSADRLFTPSANSKAAATTLDDTGQFEEFDYTPEDWATIQTALRLLEATKTTFERMQVLDGKLCSFISQVQTNLLEFSDNRRYIRSTGRTGADLYLLAQSPLNSLQLQSLIDSLASTFRSSQPESIRLLKQSLDAVMSFTENIQRMLSSAILHPLYLHLESYASLAVWSTGLESHTKSSEVQLPSFSISPTPSIQRVAEGLLNLPRLFEVHAEDVSLAFFIDRLPFVTTTKHSTLGDEPLSEQSSSLRAVFTPTSLSAAKVVSSNNALTPEQVSSTWLASLTLSLLDRFTREILPEIKAVSPSGNAQLAADLGYLSNIVQALNVESRELEMWKQYVEMSDAYGISHVPDGTDSIYPRVALLRGWGKPKSIVH